LRHLYIKRLFYQDRLGTNIGKTPKKPVFSKGPFARHLAGFLVAAGRDHYFLEYGTYSCDDSNGKPPFAGSQLENRPEYAKPLGEPEPTQLISSFVTREQLLPTHTSSEEEVVVGEVIREAVPQCECLVGNTLTTEGAAAAPPPDKYAGSCMEWDIHVWSGTVVASSARLGWIAGARVVAGRGATRRVCSSASPSARWASAISVSHSRG
jgi:hypothetical protein